MGAQKEGGFAQGLLTQSSVKLEMIGRMRRDGDRWYVYALNGAVALTAGSVVYTPAPISGHTAMVTAAAGVGAMQVTVTPTSNNATASYYKDGYLWVDGVAGYGNAYRVADNPAITAASTGIIQLSEPVRTAITASSTTSLVCNTQSGVLVLPSATSTALGAVAGVTPRDVAASYYFWNQVKGPAAVKVRGTVVIGNIVIADWTATSGSAGCVIPVASSSSISDLMKGGILGQVLTVNATLTYALVNLSIHGY